LTDGSRISPGHTHYVETLPAVKTCSADLRLPRVMRMERIARTARTSRFRRTSPFSRRSRVRRTSRDSRGSRIQRTSRGSRTSRIQRTSRGSRTSRYSHTSRFVSAPRCTRTSRPPALWSHLAVSANSVRAAHTRDRRASRAGRRSAEGESSAAPRGSSTSSLSPPPTGHLLFTSDKRTCITPLVTAFTTSPTGIVHPKPHTVASLISSRSNVPKK
jgi:hypothetical protein